ncbi:hypothetical protein G6F35_013943 [Rhizopus arrhizus]|nr:hypothetical protein G6F35_013943 [Rhizopus arrhizus]
MAWRPCRNSGCRTTASRRPGALRRCRALPGTSAVRPWRRRWRAGRLRTGHASCGWLFPPGRGPAGRRPRTSARSLRLWPDRSSTARWPTDARSPVAARYRGGRRSASRAPAARRQAVSGTAANRAPPRGIPGRGSGRW